MLHCRFMIVDMMIKKVLRTSLAMMIASPISAPFAFSEEVSGPNDVIAQSEESTISENDSILFGKPEDLARVMKAIPGNSGIEFELQPGDELYVDNGVVRVVDDEEDEILSVKPDLPEDMELYLDEDSHSVYAVNRGTSFYGCTNNKWVKWGIQGAWDGLVCVPATAASVELSPFGQAGVAAGCHAVGSGLVTAASWE